MITSRDAANELTQEAPGLVAQSRFVDGVGGAALGTFGEALAAGETLEQYEARMHMVVEGAQACLTLGTLSLRYDVELPITDVVRSMVWENVSPDNVAKMLSARSLKPEFY